MYYYFTFKYLNYDRLIFLFTFFLTGMYMKAQEPDLTGAWKLQKHMTTYETQKHFDCAKLNGPIILTFNQNGTYELVIHDLEDSLFTTIKGDWKLSPNALKLYLTNSDYVPKIPRKTVPDKTHSIVRLSNKEFAFKENLCTHDVEGISYFMKIK